MEEALVVELLLGYRGANVWRWLVRGVPVSYTDLQQLVPPIRVRSLPVRDLGVVWQVLLLKDGATFDFLKLRY